MALIKKQDASIFYEIIGESGPFITFVNGFMRPSKDFKSLARKLSQKNKRCLLIDNRQTGGSISSGDFTLETMADDILDIWAQEKITTSTLVGISMGGMIAQIVAQKSKVCEKLFLVSTTMDLNFLKNRKRFSKIEDPQIIQEELKLYFGKNFLEKNPRIIEAMAKEILSKRKEGTVEEFQIKAIVDTSDEFLDIKKILCEVVIVHGEIDNVIPALEAKKLHEAIPKSQLILRPDKGHMLLVEDFFYLEEILSNPI